MRRICARIWTGCFPSALASARVAPIRDVRQGILENPVAYEAEKWPVAAPDPVAVIEHVMEARGYRHLARLLGSQPRASEVLHRRRALTLPMIRALSAEWNVPADLLVQEYELAESATGQVP